MKTDRSRPDIFDLHARVCRTLASPTRLKIIALLARRETSVGEMAAIIGASSPNISQHLAVLRAHQIVETRKRAQTVWYRLTDRRIIRACGTIRSVLLDQMKARGVVAQRADPRYVITIG